MQNIQKKSNQKPSLIIAQSWDQGRGWCVNETLSHQCSHGYETQRWGSSGKLPIHFDRRPEAVLGLIWWDYQWSFLPTIVLWTTSKIAFTLKIFERCDLPHRLNQGRYPTAWTHLNTMHSLPEDKTFATIWVAQQWQICVMKQCVDVTSASCIVSSHRNSSPDQSLKGGSLVRFFYIVTLWLTAIIFFVVIFTQTYQPRGIGR